MSVKGAGVKNSDARRILRRPRTFVALCLLALAGALFFGGARVPVAGAQEAAGAKRKSAAQRPVKDASDGARLARAGGDAKQNAERKNGDTPAIFGCTSSPAETPIAFGQTVNNGTLSSTDCRHPQDGSFYDAYTFTGTAGQGVYIRMDSGNTAALDPYLYLVKPGETALSYTTVQNDDIELNTNVNSEIFAVLPFTGTYTIMANSRLSGQTGSYFLTLRSNCSATAIASGAATPGTLQTSDCALPDGSFADIYSFTANAGQQVSVSMAAQSFNDPNPLNNDTYLYLFGPDGYTVVATNDDSNPDVDRSSRIPPGSGFGMLPATGTYYIIANSFQPNTTGNYTVTLNRGPTDCATVGITPGQTLSGALSTADCRLLQDGSFLDRYTFSGTAGQQVAIAMTSTATPALDTYLFLLDSNGIVLAENDDIDGTANSNSRIPLGGGSFTLPVTGTYTILANAAAPNLTGSYTLALNGAGAACTYALTAASRDNVSPAGGTFDNTFTTQAGCAVAVTSNVAWLTVNSSSVSATGAGTFNYTVAANATTQSRTGTLSVSGQTFTVTQVGACQVSIFPTVRAFTQAAGAGRFTVIPATNTCAWTASTATPWITLTAPVTGTGTGRVNYTVAANTTAATRTGTIIVGDKTHTVTQTSAGTTPAVSFSNTGYAVVESEGTLTIRISVSRTGSDLSGASTVEYRTVDNPAAVPCNPTVRDDNGNLFPQGAAYARCDYATTVDTLTFNQNEVTKDFLIPLINDVHVEGPETFQIALSNPQGATTGANTTATVTIVDDDNAQPTSNPIRQNNPVGYNFFVRQQYLDFLSREPEAGQPWTNILINCANPDNTDSASPSAGCDRIIVSQSFFESDEFALKGRFVFLFYKSAFARNASTGVIDPNYVPEYEDIVSDMRRVTGTTPVETIAKRLDFADDFVSRPAFTARYNALTPAQYVDTLLANVGAALTTPDPVSGVTRNSLVNDLTTATKTRSDVLRLIAEAREVNDLQFKHAYVAMQYYGYLRRKPEPGGYQDNLNAISPPRNAPPREMVNGFLNSREYRWRFGPDL